MKKKIIIGVVITLIIICLTIVGVTIYHKVNDKSLLQYQHIEDVKYSDDKVNIYLFWGQGCPHCEELSNYLKTIPKNYRNKYNLYTFEVWNDSENEKLFESISSQFNMKPEGVPFLVIGDNFYIGFKDEQKEDILNTIKLEIGNVDHYDALKKYEGWNN